MPNADYIYMNNLDSPLARTQILIVTDDVDTSFAWSRILQRDYAIVEVIGFDDIPNVAAKIHSFSEILVDHRDTPNRVLEVCRRLRGMSQHPLLLFTYETDERFHIEAYRLGVEECISKPIGGPLLVAKTKAWLRQAFQYGDSVQDLTVDGFRLDPETRIFGTDELSVKLSNLECRLMSILMANRGQVMESRHLARRVWSMYSDPDPQMLKNLVYRLRHKVEPVVGGRQYIESVVGIGYVLRSED